MKEEIKTKEAKDKAKPKKTKEDPAKPQESAILKALAKDDEEAEEKKADLKAIADGKRE